MLLRKAVLNALYYSGVQTLLSPLCRGLGSVLMLHHVRSIPLEPFSPNYHLYVCPGFLDSMLGQLSEDFDLVSMDEVAQRLANPEYAKGKRPFIAITLDDGYRDNFENAVPVFQKHNAPYTIYVAPGMVDGGSTIWWEDLENVVAASQSLEILLPKGPTTFDCSSTEAKRRSYKELMEYLFLEVDETHQREIVSEIASKYGFDTAAHLREEVADWEMICKANEDPLCTIGAHSMSHYVLAKLDRDRLEYEIAQSRADLREKLGTPVDHLAYPYGYVQAAGKREFDLTRKLGFKTGVTTRHGVVYPEHTDHMTALPRVSVNGHHQSMHYMQTLLSGLPTRVKNYGSGLDVA